MTTTTTMSPRAEAGPQWSLRARLGLIGLIALLLGLLPSGLLLQSYLQQLQRSEQAYRGLPANTAWQAVLKGLQQHRRSAAESLSTRPAARQELAAARAQVQQALARLDMALAPLGDARHAAAAAQLRQGFAALASSLDAGQLDVGRLLQAQQQLAAQAFAALAEINADSGLLLDPQPGSHFAIQAGLQAAPRVEDALSELSSLARAAAVDDVGAVAAALTRYREQADQLLRQLQLALRGGASAQDLAPLVVQARQQRALVDSAMAAAAKDVSYPLEQLAASFETAATLQAQVSARVLQSLDAELAARRDAAALKRNLLLLLIPALLGLLALMMGRAVRQLLLPVAQIIAVTERIAGGDLSQPVPPGRRDELGRVLQALARMQAQLRQLVEQIQDGAAGIRVATHDIAAGNQDLAQRSDAAAARLQQTAAHVDALDQGVQASNGAVA